MILYSDFCTETGDKDLAVGIAISKIVCKEGLNAYATRLAKGHKIGCHSHSSGREWYVILSGEGAIWTADVVAGKLENKQVEQFKRGTVFCIFPSAAHQLVAVDDVELIFLCPDSHLNDYRVLHADLLSS